MVVVHKHEWYVIKAKYLRPMIQHINGNRQDNSMKNLRYIAPPIYIITRDLLKRDPVNEKPLTLYEARDFKNILNKLRR